MKSVKQIFRDAADYIETHGHRKDGRFGGSMDGLGEDGPACVLGAIHSVAGLTTPVGPRAYSHPEWDVLCGDLYAATDDDIVSWNDRHATKEDAVALLRRLGAE